MERPLLTKKEFVHKMNELLPKHPDYEAGMKVLLPFNESGYHLVGNTELLKVAHETRLEILKHYQLPA